MMIDKDTLIFASFAKQAGNNGCRMFNNAFNHYKINALYKSFSVDNIQQAIESAKILNFKGFAVTMPYKIEATKFVNELSIEVQQIGALNTIINYDGSLIGYNTDYIAAKSVLENYINQNLFILGNGGYASAVKYAAQILNIKYNIIDRKTWHTIKDIKNSIVYNCTPLANININESNIFIDCLITTDSGYKLSQIQAAQQFRLYTNLNFSDDEIINSFS